MVNEVIILTRSLPFHHLGGMEVVAWDLANKLKDRGFVVKIITTDFDDNNFHSTSCVEIIRIKNIPAACYSKGWWSETERLIYNWKEKENVVAVVSISSAAFSVLKYKDKFKNAKFIMQAHGTSMGELVSKLKTKKIKKIVSGIKNILGFYRDSQHYNHFDWVVAVGDAVYYDLIKFPTNLVCHKDNVIKIENGIDEELFNPRAFDREKIRGNLGVDDDTILFLSASRLHEQKGVDKNIKLFSLLRSKGLCAKYIICGNGPYEKNLRTLVQDLNLSEHVIFAGAKTRIDLANLMQAVDIFLFLTKRVEGLPLNVLEAMSAGLPMIISEHLSFAKDDNIYKCLAEKISIDEVMTFISSTRNRERKSFIPVQNTLDYSIDKYTLLFRSNTK